jgi:hypothetical protein
MATEKNNGVKNPTGKHEHPQDLHAAEKQAALAAHDQAEHDMEEDPDLSIHSPNDDLDEGETARLGEGENPII